MVDEGDPRARYALEAVERLDAERDAQARTIAEGEAVVAERPAGRAPDRVDDGVGELAPGGVVQLDRRPRRRLCELYYARIFEGYDPARRTSAEQAIQAARRSEGRPMDVIRGETNACD